MLYYRYILTHVTVPFAMMTNRQAIDFIDAGNRLDQPDRCPDDMWSIVRSCWETDPVKRPTFVDIYEQMTELYGSMINPQQHMTTGGTSPVILRFYDRDRNLLHPSIFLT